MQHSKLSTFLPSFISVLGIVFSVLVNTHEAKALYCSAPSSTVAIIPTATLQYTSFYSTGIRAFTFTATAGCVYTFSTCGQSTQDTYLRLYSGVGGALLASSDDACGTQSSITWTAPATGTYSLHLSRFTCANLNLITRVSYIQNSCPVPCPDFTITAPTSHSSTTVAAGNDCGLATSTDRTYAITIPCAGTYTFSLCGASWDTYLYLGTTCCSSNLGSNDDACGRQSSITAALSAGTVYLAVEGYLGASGAYTLNVTGGPPANDACAGATAVAIGGSVAGSTCSCATADVAPACVTTDGAAGLWYTFVGNGRRVRASLCGGTTNYDTKLRVYTGACGAFTCVAGNDDFCGVQSQVEFCSVNGTTYRVLVHGSLANCGNFTLSLTDLGTPAATSVSGGGTQCGGSMTLTASGGAGGTIYWQGTTSGGTSTATPSTSQSVSSSGTYYFRSYDGCSWGAEGSATATINALPAAVTVSGGGSFCGSITLTASGGAGGTIYWQGTTSGGTSTTTPSTSQVVTSSGTYYFRSQSGAGCWGPEGSATVTISAIPTANAGTDQSQCGNAAYTITTATAGGTYSGVTWSYVVNSGTVSSVTPTNTLGPTITPSSATGQITMTLTVNGSGGCAGTNPTDVMVMTWTNGPTANAGTDVTQCGTANVLFSGTSSSTTSWSWALLGGGTGTGTLINGGGTITNWGFTPTSASGSRTIRLTVNGSGGCTGGSVTDDIVVSWAQTPGITSTTPLTFCTGLSPIVITGVTGTGSIGSYTWTPSQVSGTGSITSGGTTSSPTFTPTTTSGEYNFVVQANGNSYCAGTNPTASVNLRWAQPPAITTVGAATTTCGTDPHPMTGAAATGAFGSVSWSGNPNGSWTTTNPTDPSLWVFTPTTTSGSFTSTLTITGTGLCTGTTPSATRVITWSAPPTVNAGTDISVCTGMTAIAMAGASANDYNTYLWTEAPGGLGSWNQGGSITAAQFTPSTASGTVTATLTVTRVGGACNGLTADDTREIVWNTGAVINAVTPTAGTDCNTPSGYINIDATGAAPIQYSIDNGANYFASEDFFSLTPGNYTIVVLDASTCPSVYGSNPVVVGGPPPVVAASVVVSANNLCAGGIIGAITITGVAGGAGGPFTYALDGLGSTRIYDLTSDPMVVGSLSAGTYSVVVMDKFGCESVIYAVTVTDPPQLTINTMNIVDVVGCGSSGTGSITVTASGGTGTLNYYLNGSVNTPATSGAWTGLPGGSYEVMVQDANACQTFTKTRINAPWTVNAGNDIYNCGTVSTTLPGSIIGQLPSTCTTTLTCSSSCGMPGSTTSCTYRITLQDAFGDGWNGGSVSVIVNGTTVLNNVTLSSGYGPVNYTFTATDGQSIVVNYTAGSWSAENHYRVGRNSESYSFYGSTVGATPPASNTFTASCAYCAVASNDFSDERITNVSLNGASQASGASWYTNFSGPVFTTVDRGIAYNLSVTIGISGEYTEYIRAWFDWNRDGDFTDAGENYLVFSGPTVSSTRTLSITIPAGAALGETKMRIGLSYSGDMPSDACGLNVAYGEYEDYRINIIDNTTIAAVPSYSWAPSGGTALSATVSPAFTTNYTLTVNDGCGCIQNNQTTVFVSNESTTSSQVNVDCFGNANGCVTLNPTSGIQPYILFGPSNVVKVYGGSMRPITVNNTSGTAYSNHPVKMTIPFSAGMRSDFGNLRFYDSNQSKLSYWIESYVLSTSAVVWVKIPTLPTGNSTIYMTFGDVIVTSESEGDNVFTFFDDFNFFSTTKWTQGVIAATSGANWSYYGGNLIGGNTNRVQTSVPTFSGNYISEGRVFESAAAVNGFTSLGFYGSAGNGHSILAHNGAAYARNDGAWESGAAFTSLNTWVKDYTRTIGAGSFASRTGGTTWTQTSNNSGLSGERVRLGARGDDLAGDQNFSAQWDWLFVRQYISAEPSITLGAVVTSDNQFCGFAPGSYNFNVVDVAGCNNSINATITQPSAALSLTVTMTPITCYAPLQGSINLTPAGGTPTYFYNWAGPGGFSSTIEDPSVTLTGIYNVTVADQNACVANSSVTVTQLTPIESPYHTWKGSVNTLWEQSGNWDCGIVPTSISRVVIPAVPVGGATIFPVINNGINANVYDIDIRGSAANRLTITGTPPTGGTLQIHKP